MGDAETILPAEQVRLVWIDLEMTGLNPEVDRILEIATVVTDGNLVEIARGPELVLWQRESLLFCMNEWCTDMHNKSGLLYDVRNSRIEEEEATLTTLNFLKQHVKPQTSPMCGNTVSQDRRFLIKYMPTLAEFFHYRHIDVSTIKLLARYWYQNLPKPKEKASCHRALADILESIEELKIYRELIFKK